MPLDKHDEENKLNMQILNISKETFIAKRKIVVFTLEKVSVLLKVVVRADILPRDFLQSLGNYYLSLIVAKFKV